MKAYQIKISLDIVRPEVWRRAVIPAGITFSRLASMLNDIMGWMGGHLYAVTTEDRHYISGMPDDVLPEILDQGDFDFSYAEGADGQTTEIDPIFDCSGRISYIYDLGDEWIHTVIIEESREDYSYQYPQVIEGEGSCPPDDCGGPFLFMEMIEHPDQVDEDMRDMFLEEMEDFRPEEVNEYLQSFYGAERCGEIDLHPIEDRWFPNLRDSLKGYRVDDLKTLCKELRISGYSSLKKDRLVELVASGLTEKERMEFAFSSMTDQDLEMFELLCQHPYDAANLNKDAVDSVNEFMYMGYLFQTLEYIYFVPEEIKACYETLDKDALLKKRQRVRLIIDYCQAAVNLYGIVETSQLTKIFNDWNEKALFAGELQRVAEMASKRGDSLVKWKKGYIYDANIEWDVFDLILEQQRGKPYYVPEKSEFLRYADAYYCEKILAWEAVQNFVIKELGQNRFTAELLCHELQALVHIGADLESLFVLFAEFQVPEPDEYHIFQLSGMIMEAWNCTRMITNRGFTPNEMANDCSERVPTEAVPNNVIPFPGKKQ